MHATIPIIPSFLVSCLLINFAKMSLLSGPLWLRGVNLSTEAGKQESQAATKMVFEQQLRRN